MKRESDITVIINVEGIRCGFLIEDKIDAIAMKDQHDRYLERGKKGIDQGEYAEFFIFIFCPLKYRENNTEAQKYEFFLSYEDW